LAGVTGTNGKTSVSQWIAQALAAMGQKCAVIGTLGNGFAPNLEASPNTTPDAVTLHSALARYVAQGAEACAMEVSSIGMDQSRVSGAAFDVAVFTNLTRDHLDYHGTMDSYAACKEAFFRMPGLKAAVINLDDAFGAALVVKMKGCCKVMGYTLASGHPAEAVDDLLQAENIEMGAAAVAFSVRGQHFTAPLVGRFNIANLLAVIGALLTKGETLADIAAAVAKLTPPPGRMDIVNPASAERQPLVVVDYSHTPDALEKALDVLRETATARGGKLVCVFGCGGERDSGKRPQMGAIAENLADRVLVTADNPRGEDAQKIFADIVAGFSGPAQVVADRGEAIALAVAEAAPVDVILLAGKGHETTQEIAGVKHPFADAVAARTALERRP
jgi:UDP-N-acetylmuramoyl-L-alanyl-D-glutamate--2,6-diaminopimelate ligase